MKTLIHGLSLTSKLAIACLILTACGGDSTSPTSTAPNDGIRTIVITGNDQMKFSENRFNASPGEKIRIEFKNIGRMPKETMGHNWVLFDQLSEADLNRLVMEAAKNRPEYLPADRSAILAKTKVLGPGESETIVFDAPSKPGEYRYICTFPGHAVMMRGVMVVR